MKGNRTTVEVTPNKSVVQLIDSGLREVDELETCAKNYERLHVSQTDGTGIRMTITKRSNCIIKNNQ